MVGVSERKIRLHRVGGVTFVQHSAPLVVCLLDGVGHLAGVAGFGAEEAAD